MTYHHLSKRLASILTCLSILLICHSCISITGLTDGYSKLSKANQQRVSRLSDAPKAGEADVTVLIATADEIRSLLCNSSHKYQLVYEYNPQCPSEVCIPISSFLSLCKRYSAEPVVLTRYMDNSLFAMDVAVPIYAMDHQKYGTGIVPKYAPRFMSDLTGTEIKEDGEGNLFLFKEGNFVLRSNIDRMEGHLKELSLR